MKILFLHGRESTPETSHTAKSIKEYFHQYKVFVPHYEPNTTSQEDIAKFLDSYYDEHIGDEPCVVIGISLGGYWALEMTNFTKARNVILLNPSLMYYGEEPFVSSEVGGHIIVNMDDEVVDPHTALKFEGRFKIDAFQTGGHRMSNMTAILPLIEASVNHFEYFIE